MDSAIPARGPVRALALLITAAALGLYAYPALTPRLFFDDFGILLQSWTARQVGDNLWLPHNEHAMPLGRLAAGALVGLTPGVAALPWAAAGQNLLALALAVGLVGWFVGRELGHPFPGLLAMALFGVSLRYHETVTWYAAGFWLLGFDNQLLALVAAQAWRQTGRPAALALCVLLCALAPGWYAGGVLAGPLCALYLLPRSGRRWWVAGLPVVGTAAFLALSLPRNAERIAHAHHYGGGSAWQAFDPRFGLTCTGRAVVDTLFVNPFGFGVATCALWLVPVVLVGLAGLTAWWWRRAADRRLLWLGLGLIVGHYFLSFSFRSAWSYDTQMVDWSRYHLSPFLGMVLIACGGLRGRLPESGGLTRRQVRLVVGLVAALFAVQLPAGIVSWNRNDFGAAEQRAVLRRVDEVDARCRELHIGVGVARDALPPLTVPMSGGLSAWDCLRGSDGPRPVSVEEARRLLGEQEGPVDSLQPRF
jgi:hypothetical protein